MSPLQSRVRRTTAPAVIGLLAQPRTAAAALRGAAVRVCCDDRFPEWRDSA